MIVAVNKYSWLLQRVVNQQATTFLPLLFIRFREFDFEVSFAEPVVEK